MTGSAPPSSDDLEQIYPQQLPKEVEKLHFCLRDIQKSGWQDNNTSLKQHLQSLQNVAIQTDHPSVQILVDKIDQILTPLFQAGKAENQEEKLNDALHYIQKLQEVIKVNAISSSEAVIESSSPVTKHTLIIGLKDTQLAEEISQQVKYFGYTSAICPDLESILKAAQSNDALYSAIILDTEFCLSRDPEPLKAISANIPIIFVSNQQDVATRLFAVKAGGQAFLVRPLEFTSLIEKVDQVVTPSTESPPYRILIVEDSRTQAGIIRKHLEEAGMIAHVLVDPMRINELLTEFQPDLILLDLYMPMCSGIELARVIRQQEAFVSIPIVYLSSEDDTKKQLSAMKGGGDDFLTKPITPKHLIDAVITRAARSRQLRSEMILDSLTGLLNHTRILEQLDMEIARAKRNNSTLSFAMIDIDHFKAVNDSHGHPVGDRVIKGLARLLKQRLRKMDSIGRYGGEEFAILMPQTEGKVVIKALEEIRRGFSKLLHRSSDPAIEFSATFSAGLAQLSNEIDTVDKIVQAADKALYMAKEQGRNCIVFYNQVD